MRRLVHGFGKADHHVARVIAGPCACPIRQARKPCCGTTNYTMSSSCSTGISAAAQGAAAVRFFSISRRPAIRPRRAASPFRHAIWRACRLICRSERFSGSRDSDRRRRSGRGARVPEASAARPLRVSYRRPRTGRRRRDPAVGIAGQRLAHEFIPGERTSEPVARHDLKTPDQVHMYGRALPVILPSRRLHDPCCR